MNENLLGTRWKELTFEERHEVVFTTVYKTDEERDEVARKIHESLRGSEAYINSDIVLNVNEPRTIKLVVDDFSKDVPTWLKETIKNYRNMG